MDKIDLKLLGALLLDSRQGTTALASKAGISREQAHYRISQLEKSGVIRRYVTHVDYAALGFQKYTVFIQYGKVTGEQEKEFLAYLSKHAAVSWVGTITGKWSLTFDVYAASVQQCTDILGEVVQKLPLLAFRVLPLAHEQYYFHKIVDASQTQQHRLSQQKIDATDRKLLQLLADNSRISYVELGEKTALTANAIKRRIQLLEKSFIRGYSVSLDHHQFGYEWHGIQVKLLQADPAVREKIRSFCNINERVIFCYEYSITGEYDFDIGVLVKNSTELRSFITLFRNTFTQHAAIEDVFLVLEEHTSHSLPPAVFR